jgi:hypothetical protein
VYCNFDKNCIGFFFQTTKNFLKVIQVNIIFEELGWKNDSSGTAPA